MNDAASALCVNDAASALCVNDATSAFPSGLVQPAGAYRFSADALYLAHFAATSVSGGPAPATARLVELGTGCGVAALATLRLLDRAHGPLWQATGVDCQPGLVEAARDNAARLGLAQRFAAHCADVADPEALLTVCAPARLVICNPPWRLEGHGLLPPSPVRRTALFGTPETLPHFARAAASLLAPDGTACFVLGTERLPDLREALCVAGLVLRLEQPVITHETRPAPFVLVEAGRG